MKRLCNNFTQFWDQVRAVDGGKEGGQHEELSDVGVSSLMDTWLVLRTIETDGVRNRVLYVVKSRGIPHSMQKSLYQLTNRGVSLIADSGPNRRRGSKEV